MFAQLGSVVFEVVGALTEFGARREYSYAEHARIETKPTVQFTGEGLEEAELGFALDDWLCEPSAALEQLHDMAAAHEAVVLLWGDTRQGRYVIRGIEHTVALAAGNGRPTRITGRIRLQEWVAPPQGTETRRTDTAPAVEGNTGVAAVNPAASRPPNDANHRTTPVNASTRRPK